MNLEWFDRAKAEWQMLFRIETVCIAVGVLCSGWFGSHVYRIETSISCKKETTELVYEEIVRLVNDREFMQQVIDVSVYPYYADEVQQVEIIDGKQKPVESITTHPFDVDDLINSINIKCMQSGVILESSTDTFKRGSYLLNYLTEILSRKAGKVVGENLHAVSNYVFEERVCLRVWQRVLVAIVTGFGIWCFWITRGR